MIVLYENGELCKIPDSLCVNDTIIKNGKIYIITSKTYDFDNKELYCKVNFYDDNESSKQTVCEILSELYARDLFETSGANTNLIENNPRLIIVLIIAAVIIDEEHFKKNCSRYKNNIIDLWNSKLINWSSIFDDEPKIKMDDIDKIKLACCELFTAYKLSPTVWPFTVPKLQAD